MTAASGAALVSFAPGEPTMTHLAWIWAPALVVLAVWVARQTRRNIPGRLSLVIYPIALAMLLAGLGGLYQATTTAPEAAAGPMPGKLVDVGGYRLHLSCTGTGSPTVVLLNGLGETSPEWARITRSSPAPPVCARTIAPGRAGATTRLTRRTPSTPPPICTDCSPRPARPARTSWRDTPAAACTP
jgi:hypothetical protein